MTRQFAILGLLALLASIAQAKPALLPPEIDKVRQADFADCRQAGGRPSAKPGYIQIADFNDDGQSDYVVDDGALDCAGASSLDCGSGGCSIELYVSTPNGYRSANLQRLGFGATIKRSAGGPILIVGGRGGTIRYRWNGSALQPIKGR